MARLRIQISVEEKADKIGDVVQELSEHKLEGKAVIRMWM